MKAGKSKLSLQPLITIALVAALGHASAEPPAGKGNAADLTPPQIILSTVLPAVATSSSTPYSAIYTDNVELAYVRTASSQPFVFMAQGMKTYQSEDAIPVFLGQTTTRTLMAVDMSGNVGKLTITIASPEVAFKPGSYAISGTSTYPAGYDCRPSFLFPAVPNPMPGSGPLDGQSFGTAIGVTVFAQQWSVADGYSPNVAGYSPGIEPFPGSPSAPKIPLSATSFSFERLYSSQQSSQPGYSYEARIKGTAQVIQNSPRMVQLSLQMTCNNNNTGWVNGNTATFIGQLAP